MFVGLRFTSIWQVLLLSLLMGIFQSVSRAEEFTKKALVVSNANYADEGVPNLENALADGILLSSVLQSADFETTTVENATGAQLVRAVEAFADEASDAAELVFVYSGHGIENAKRTILLGVDAELRGQTFADEGVVDVSQIVGAFAEANPRVCLFFLDCCRELHDLELSEEIVFRRIIEQTRSDFPEMLISFSSEPGGIAVDGRELGLASSPYAKSLAKGISEGREILSLMKTVRQDVFRLTGGLQRTWESSSLVEDYYLSSAPLTLPEAEESEEGDTTGEQEKAESAGFWKVIRHRGKDYVTVSQLHKFYGFERRKIGVHQVDLIHPKIVFSLIVEGQELWINDYLFYLSFPTVLKEGELLVSTVDLAKLIDPIARPERIIRDGDRRDVSLVIDETRTTKDSKFSSALGESLAGSRSSIKHFISAAEKERVEWLLRETDENSIVVYLRFDVPGIPPNSVSSLVLAPQGTPPTGGRGSEAISIPMIANRFDAESVALATSIHAGLIGKDSSRLQDLGVGRTLDAELRSLISPGILVNIGRLTGEFRENPQRISSRLVEAIERYNAAISGERKPEAAR